MAVDFGYGRDVVAVVRRTTELIHDVVLPVEDVHHGDADALHQSITAATEIKQPETEEISA
jgi:hypothetical protein